MSPASSADPDRARRPRLRREPETRLLSKVYASERPSTVRFVERPTSTAYAVRAFRVMTHSCCAGAPSRVASANRERPLCAKRRHLPPAAAIQPS